jgi:magnesium-transporting ATPase (P-type)
VVPAAAALFLLGDLRGAWAVSAMAVVNALIGLVQEVRAKRHLDRLALLSETRARVIRDGAEHLILAGDVVLGDFLKLAPGEPVVADGEVLQAEFLEVDEALLTGESDPVPRRPGQPLLSGSFVVAGQGVFRADRVGSQAFAHQTTVEARQYRHAPSPVQRTIDALIRILTAIAVLLCGFFVMLHFVGKLPTTDLVQMIAATITSLVPQGLVLMTTLALTLGAVRLTTQGAVVQRLAAVETMASVDVLCTDKTGTLTTGNLTVDRIEALAGSDADVRAKLGLFVWSTADEGNRSIQALRSSLGPPEEGFSAIDQVPFKAQNRFSAVRVHTTAGEWVLVLGSLDALQPRFVADQAGLIEKRFAELLPSGLRLLAFAEGEAGGDLANVPLRPIAMVAMSDELRPGVVAVLESLTAERVRFLILSGDHPETVRATVARLKLPLSQDSIRTGADLEAATDRDAMIAAASVFGRVSPKQKLEIITTLQSGGQKVAMIGDGVNDILAIKKADLGIAMGAGSSATKTVADLVLEKNNFDLLPAALAEGRTVLDNVRRAAKLFLLKNVYTLLLIVVLVGLLGEAFPYLPQQVTLLNALTIGGPVLLIMLSKERAGATSRMSFLREVGHFALGMGSTLALAGLTIWHHPIGHSVEEQRTLLLSLLILAGLGNAVFVGEGGRRFFAWAVLALSLYLTAMYVEPLAYFFALTPLTFEAWGMVSCAAILGGFLGWLILWLLDGRVDPKIQD